MCQVVLGTENVASGRMELLFWGWGEDREKKTNN